MSMIDLKQFEVWFVTGSQHLYGPETLKKVAEHSKEIAAFFGKSSKIPVTIVFKPVMTGPDEITALCWDANASKKCIGVITWCHTFSPSKMWINGLKILQKPLLHLHTQYNRDLPWGEVDMDFINLNQSAHSDRKHGSIMTRMCIHPKAVVGVWNDDDTIEKISSWIKRILPPQFPNSLKRPQGKRRYNKYRKGGIKRNQRFLSVNKFSGGYQMILTKWLLIGGGSFLFLLFGATLLHKFFLIDGTDDVFLNIFQLIKDVFLIIISFFFGRLPPR
jgi:hypothetical protein